LFSSVATCPTTDIDMGFFVDSSDAVSFQSMLSFVNEVIGGFNVGTNAVRIAVAQYTDTGDIAIFLGQYTNSISLRTAVGSIPFVKTNQSFFTSAFGTMQTVFTNATRTGAASLLIYVTNRVPVDTHDQLSSAITALQSAGIRLVSVGAFQPGTLDDSMRLLLSYYYDVILVNGCALTIADVNQTIFHGCPLKGYSNYFLTSN
jgi:hypothetical protein